MKRNVGRASCPPCMIVGDYGCFKSYAMISTRVAMGMRS